MNIRPLGENVLIEPHKTEKKTATGIYLPEQSSDERKQQGKVMAVGPSEKITVKKGQKVIFKRYGSSEEIEMNGTSYLLIESKDILAVVE